jgi:hypothetical protein
MYQVSLLRGDGWDRDGKLIRSALVTIRNVESLTDAEYFFRLFYLPFTGDSRCQASSGNWQLADGSRMVRSFTADVKPSDNWPNLTYWPDGKCKTSVSVHILEVA